ncbi:MAG TPA: HEAT repeat domain-containing protein, partial [Roseimicrobium sp.]|nr:HEAT repeat domain-containing protein [Roseimicrobium sp.]
NSADKMDGKLVWGMYPTDIDFSPGGGAYVLDWVQGWEKTGKGRIFRLSDEASENDPVALETKRLLAEGMANRPVPELISLLGHTDQRVRISAQHMLADIGGLRREWKYKALTVSVDTSRGTKVLADAATTQTNQLARIHAIWALGQIARQHDGKGLFDILPLLEDSNPEIRAQMAKVCGDAVFARAYMGLVANLKHPSARVQFYSAEALGKLGRTDAIKPLIELALANDGKDRFVRHAIVMALVRMKDRGSIMSAAHHSSKEVRMVALQVMRRLEWPEISLFLHYPETALVTEAARAINDVPITNAAPKLAALLDINGRVAAQAQSDIAVRRIINTHFRLGQAENAKALAAFACQESYLPALRIEALESLGEWHTPSGRDHVTGLWQPVTGRNAAAAGSALETVLPVLLGSKQGSVRIAALDAVGNLGLTNTSDRVFALLSDKSVTDEVRAAALRTLATLKSPALPEALKLARADRSEIVRKEAGRLAGQGDANEAVLALSAQLSTGSTSEKQT